ncbi:MAG: fused MFS/spermidine synthase [Planctomycetota bacterium]|nr:fused MFS/spermidine synthase [Planctomycetota bacterium]
MGSHSSRSNATLLGLNFALAIFVSAFLLFQVQPLISKFILPWFGGSPAVWTTCMLFFQVLLFAGYTYAHCSVTYLSARMQGLVHLGLMSVALVCALFFIPPGSGWKPVDSDQPVLRIMLLLSASVGFPYFVLSATGPLLQAWFARSFAGRSPYRLYALSNIGSLLALLTYPFVVEPAWDSYQQAYWWIGGFVFFCVLGAYAATQIWASDRSDDSGTAGHNRSGVNEGYAAGQELASPELSPADKLPDPTWLRRLLWIALPAFASMMLLATTYHVCQDVAPVPFLWVVPLSLYLLSFIISFDAERWYIRPFFAVVGLAFLYVSAGMPSDLKNGGTYKKAVAIIEWYQNDFWRKDEVTAAGLQQLLGYDADKEQALVRDEGGRAVWHTMPDPKEPLVDKSKPARDSDEPRIRLSSSPASQQLSLFQLATLPGYDSSREQKLGVVDGQLTWTDSAANSASATNLTRADGFDLATSQALMHRDSQLRWIDANSGWTPKDRYEFTYKPDYRDELFIHFGALFCVCMVCHGELVRLRPAPRYLTSFYLLISAGGALGGLFCSLIAPMIFSTHFEWTLSLYGGMILLLVALLRSLIWDRPIQWLMGRLFGVNPQPASTSSDSQFGRPWFSLAQVLVALAMLLLVPVVLYYMTTIVMQDVVKFQKTDTKDVIARSRNFYGTVRVEGRQLKEFDLDQPAVADAPSAEFTLHDIPKNAEEARRKRNWYEIISLYNGRILHGMQFTDPDESRLPTTYYTTDSGVGRAIGYFKQTQNHFRVGAIGLGTGTLAAYSTESQQKIIFYEINPQVEALAREHFTYLSNAAEPVDILLGDARLSLERQAKEGSQQFDVLILDAFSGDSIPSHLLTKECFEIYQKHVDLKHGIIAFHISNRYLDLLPVVRGLAQHFHVKMLTIHSEGESEGGERSDWVLLTNNEEFLRDDTLGAEQETTTAPEELFYSDFPKTVDSQSPDGVKANAGQDANEVILNWPRTILWTDAYSNLFDILMGKDD